MPSTNNESPAPARSSTRVALWDHARYFLLFLIATGHLMEPMRQSSDAAYLIYAFVYLFHVAALLGISGFFSKPDLTHRNIRSILQLIVVWVMWEALFAVVYHYAEDADFSTDTLVVPSWGLWFLLTLASLRVLLPIIARLKHPMLVSIGLALAAGLVPKIGTEFSVARTLFFLPFFVAGWLAKDRGWTTRDWFARPTRALRAAAAGVFVVVAAALLAVPNLEQTWRVDRWALGRNSYQNLLEPGGPAMIDALRPHGVGENVFVTDLTGVAIRLAVIAVGALMTLSLLILVPRRSLGGPRLARMMQRTLYVYLLHILLIVLLRPFDVVENIGGQGLLGVFALVAVAACLTVVLSTDLVASVTRPFIEPNIDWMMLPDSDSSARTAGDKSGDKDAGTVEQRGSAPQSRRDRRRQST